MSSKPKLTKLANDMAKKVLICEIDIIKEQNEDRDHPPPTKQGGP
jgi:hypothetical protein